MGFSEQLVAFAVALAPRATQRSYMNFSTVDLRSGAAPSAGLACQLASAMIAAAGISILLGRPPPRPAPAYCQFDAYRNVFRRGRLLFGNRGPLQRLKRWLFNRHLTKLGVFGPDAATPPGGEA